MKRRLCFGLSLKGFQKFDSANTMPLFRRSRGQPPSHQPCKISEPNRASPGKFMHSECKNFTTN
jgi:hypothetical protein